MDPNQASVGSTTAREPPVRSISVVIPLYNEEGSLQELHQRVSVELARLALSYEIIFVDDGSKDSSFTILSRIHSADPHTKVARLRRNCGKAMALTAGFRLASGDVVFTMDADLQDEPAEIPRFLEKLAEGYDVVSGWKKQRRDPLSKRLPSKLFNATTHWVTGVNLHDMNCGYKAYRNWVVKRISLYGELHRFVPVLAAAEGARIGELVVEHHPRVSGRSKYGLERIPRGFLDLLTVFMLTVYRRRPLHLFGGMGLSLLTLGMGILAYLVAGHVVFLFTGNHRWEIRERPLLSLSIWISLVGVLLISNGLLAEMIVSRDAAAAAAEQVAEVLSAEPRTPGSRAA
jgi:glycosyltransferase involved in cell wall biosynthesis